MLRLRLVSGEESVFRSVEELALGIQSGAVSPDAQIFDTVTEQWLPVTSHPEYEQARQRAVTLTGISGAEPPPLPALIEAAGGTTVPIYQMVSRSAREIAERRRPRWVVPAVSSIVIVSFVAVVSMILLPEPPGAEEAVRVASSPQHISSSPGHLGPMLSEEAMRAARNAPYNLANRFTRAVDNTKRLLADSSLRLGLSDLIHPDRLKSEDGLVAGRETLALFDTVVQSYRTRERRLDSIYRDSATALAREGSWSRSDLQEWRLRTPQLEPAAEVTRVDSILRTLDRLYALLLEQQGSVILTPAVVRFNDAKAGTSYDALRAALIRQASLPVPKGDRFPEPLSLLLEGVGDPLLPMRTAR